MSIIAPERLKEVENIFLDDNTALTKLKTNDIFEEYIRLRRFKEYWDELYGKGLEIANWHMNGQLEDFDNFYDSAMDEYDKDVI